MLETQEVWLSEDVLKFARNASNVLVAQSCAVPSQWNQLGTDGVYVWGEYQSTRNTYYTNKPVQVVIDLSLAQINSNGLACSCRREKPCIHSLGLFLLFQQSPDVFQRSEHPNFVREHITKQRQYRAPQGDVLGEIQRGLASLDVWLINLIKHGLAEPHVREFDYWDQMADRMLAAWMPGVSQWLREIANIPVRGGDWVAPLLDELGRLYLLAKSFERFENLPFETQADLREAVGWQVTLADFEAPTPIRDRWLVIGQQKRILRDQTPEQIIWLYGIQSKRMAMLHDLGSEAIANGLRAQTGQTLDIALIFIPSRAKLRALPVFQHAGASAKVTMAGVTINEAVALFGGAVAANPWIRHYPMLLREVYVTRFDKYWILRHADGTYLPIASYFKHKWVMYAASGGHPISVAGIWNGNVFFPLSLFHNGNMIDLTNTMNYK